MEEGITRYSDNSPYTISVKGSGESGHEHTVDNLESVIAIFKHAERGYGVLAEGHYIDLAELYTRRDTLYLDSIRGRIPVIDEILTEWEKYMEHPLDNPLKRETMEKEKGFMNLLESGLMDEILERTEKKK